MNLDTYLMTLAGMGLVTYLPRWLPLALLSRRPLSPWLKDWLDLVPVAVLCALLAPALFADTASRSLAPLRPELMAAVPTLLVALKTRSLGGTALLGMAFYWLLGWLMGISTVPQ